MGHACQGARAAASGASNSGTGLAYAIQLFPLFFFSFLALISVLASQYETGPRPSGIVSFL
jgi:hypothetical protein